MKMLINEFEMLDHSGKFLARASNKKEILALPGRDGDMIRETRGKIITITHKWDKTSDSWKLVQ